MAGDRELDVFLAERLFNLEVVARDWPCGNEPECGCYEAAQRVDDSDGEGGRMSWHDTLDAVFVPQHGQWPPDADGWACVEPVPGYSEGDWPLVADAMVERGWMVIVKWTPPNLPNYGSPKPHRMMPRYGCELAWMGHHQVPPSPRNAFVVRDEWATADTPGLAVCRAARAALEAAKEG